MNLDRDILTQITAHRTETVVAIRNMTETDEFDPEMLAILANELAATNLQLFRICATFN